MAGHSNNNNNNNKNRNHHGYRQNLYNEPQQSQGLENGGAAAVEAVVANTMNNPAPPMSSLAAAALRGRKSQGSQVGSQLAISRASPGFAPANATIRKNSEIQSREPKGQEVNSGENSNVRAALEVRKKVEIQEREANGQEINRVERFSIVAADDKDDVRKNDEIQGRKGEKLQSQPVKTGPVSSLAAAAAAGRRKGEGLAGQTAKNIPFSNFGAGGRNNGKAHAGQMVQNSAPLNRNDGSWNKRENTGQIRKNGSSHNWNTAGARNMEAQSQTYNGIPPNVDAGDRDPPGRVASKRAPPNVDVRGRSNGAALGQVSSVRRQDGEVKMEWARNGSFPNVPASDRKNRDEHCQIGTNSATISGSGDVGAINDSQSMSTANGTFNKNKNRNRNRNRNRKKKAQAAQSTQAIVMDMENLGDQLPLDVEVETRGGWCSSSVATSITNGTSGRYNKRNRNRKKKAAPVGQQDQVKSTEGQPYGDNVRHIQINDGKSVGSSSNVTSGKWKNRNRNNNKKGQNRAAVDNRIAGFAADVGNQK